MPIRRAETAVVRLENREERRERRLEEREAIEKREAEEAAKAARKEAMRAKAVALAARRGKDLLVGVGCLG